MPNSVSRATFRYPLRWGLLTCLLLFGQGIWQADCRAEMETAPEYHGPNDHRKAEACYSLSDLAEKDLLQTVYAHMPNTPGQMTLSLLACQDLNQDGKPEVVIRAGGQWLGHFPVLTFYTLSGQQARQLGLIESDSFKMLPRRQGASWPDLLTITHRPVALSVTGGRPIASVMRLVWQSDKYQPSTFLKDLAAEAALSIYDLPRAIGVDDARVRSGPSLKSAILTLLNQNDSVMASLVEVAADNILWVKIQLPDGRIGWINSDFIEDRD